MRSDRHFEEQEKPFVVFSTTSGYVPKSFPYVCKSVLGCFDNGQEDSFITCYNGFEWLRDYLASDGQQYYLYVDSFRNAYLLHINEEVGNSEPVGKFQRATEQEAKSMSAWTYDSSGDAYWVVK